MEPALSTDRNDSTVWEGSPAQSHTFEEIGRDNVYALVEAAGHAGSIVLTTMDPVTRFPTKEVTLVQMDGTAYTEIGKVIPSYVAPVA